MLYRIDSFNLHLVRWFCIVLVVVMFIKANAWQSWLLNRLGLYGITAPWGRVYVLAEHWDNDELRLHEQVHLDQIKRDGACWFSIKYTWWLLRYGYRNNPYEVEAYKISDGK